MKRLSELRVLEQIEATRGNIAAVARAFGVARQSVAGYIASRPMLVQALKDARESMVDVAESALYSAVVDKEGWAVCFTLKCLGKERGYIERTEHEHSGPNGGPVQLLIEEIIVTSSVPANQETSPASPGSA